MNNNTITALFMGRTDPKTDSWYPIAKMNWLRTGSEHKLKIVFTRGAEKFAQLYPNCPNIITFGSLAKPRFYPNFSSCAWSNRLPVNRPIDPELAEYLGLGSNPDPIAYASRSGGYRHGDYCDLFPETAKNDFNNYQYIFRPVARFAPSLPTHCNLNWIRVGDRVTINSNFKLEVSGQTIGSAPPYIKYLYQQYGLKLHLNIHRVNPTAPQTYQFLVLATLLDPKTTPFSAPDFLPIDGTV